MNSDIPAISPIELKTRLDKKDNDYILLDVRGPQEHEICSLSDQLIPLHLLTTKFQELPKDKDIIIYCHHGSRSFMACQFLAAKGHKVYNLEGGIDLWSQQVDPSCPRY